MDYNIIYMYNLSNKKSYLFPQCPSSLKKTKMKLKTCYGSIIEFTVRKSLKSFNSYSIPKKLFINSYLF